MLLSKLELNGFKSFPDKTELRFDEGIMGVVGPNGCGKTNILDSIRWVLGEQRSSLLRASRVNEVIFNGTLQLRSADMAEVSLTIKNNRGVLPLEYEELVVTRRLYRSGESEYLLNKTRCRLKDITNLFADTGMGVHAYSIFQQGMVDAVLSDKAEERRYLFEEAAGITKYKNRKKEALKKLENTESDLIRLNDIIAEIAKNVRSLKRQALKARQFKTVKEDLRKLETLKASARIHDFENEIGRHDSIINNRKTEKEAINSAINMEEISVEELKIQVAELNEKITSQAALAADFGQQAIRVENNLSNIQARLESGKENVKLWNSETESLQRRIESFKTEQTQTALRHTEKTGELNNLMASIDRIESDVLVIKEQLDKSKADLDTARENLHRRDNVIAANQAKLDAVIASINRLANLNRDIDESLSKYQARIKSSEENLQLQKEHLKRCEDEIASLDNKINANQQEHLSIIARIDEIKGQLSSCRADKSAASAKLEMLSKMVLEHEGYGSGIKALFAWPEKPDGIIDTLANLVTADKQYYLAVEAALNTYGQLVICKSRRDALTGIEYLRANSAGRVGFLLLDSMGHSPTSKSLIGGTGYIGCVAELINCQEFLQPAMKKLFSDIAVFRPGEIPVDFDGKAVDLNGSFHNHVGILEGGKSSVTLIGRKSEMSDMQELIDAIDNKAESLQGSLDRSNEALERANLEAGNLRDKKKSCLSKRENLIGDMTRLDFEFQENVTRLNELARSSAEAGDQANSLNRDKTEILDKIDREEKEKQAVAEVLFDQSLGHKKLEEKYEQEISKLNNARLKSVELTGLLHKLEEDGKRYNEMIDEALGMIGQKSRMIEDEQDKWRQLGEEMVNSRGQLAKIFEAKEKVDEGKDGLNNSRRDLTEKLNESEVKLKRLRSDLNNINESIHQEELKFADFENSIKNIRQSIFHEYGIEVTGSKPDDYDEEAVDSEIESLQHKIENVGLVNMLADEEYGTEKDRLEFLERQFADLQDAKNSLLDVIRKINKTAEEKFSETFGLIKENFQNVFETLFDGGKAEIKLTDPDDLLDSPIEIIARPGSKKLVSVNQLSGGERALTAIALLFSIYMVKPSPFCILDEIDAPLDDANVTRFIKLVNNFTHSTQFIVITHNKKTMEAADILYGITMEKPGASNIVSVKFNGNSMKDV